MKKDYTPFGKYFSKLRSDKMQTITDAAKLLGVSIAYISSVEHGDRDIPNVWVHKIIGIYKLNEDEQRELKKAYYDTPSQKKISISDVELCITNMINANFKDEEKERLITDFKRRLNDLKDNLK